MAGWATPSAATAEPESLRGLGRRRVCRRPARRARAIGTSTRGWREARRYDYCDMRLASLLVDGRPRAAVLASDLTLVPLADLVSGAPDQVLDFLAAGPGLWDRVREVARSAGRGQALQ